MTPRWPSFLLRGFVPGLVLVVALAACGSSRTIDPVQVLHYVDEPTETLRTDLALTYPRHDVTRTHDAAEFNDALASGGFELVFVFIHATAPNTSAGPVPDRDLLEAHLAEGGRLVLADFSRTAGYAELFDASYTGARNLREAELTDTAVAEGVARPLELVNPSGWSDYAMGLAAGPSASEACRFENGDACLVRSHQGRAALLGFLGDTVPESQARAFWSNLIGAVLGR